MINRIVKFFGVVITVLALTLAVPVQAVFASNPLLTVKYLVTNLNKDGGAWKESTTAANEDVLLLYVELHNTEVGTQAVNPRVRATFTTGTFTNGTSTVRFTADNASEVRDQIALTIPGSGSLAYITGTTHLTWDPDGDRIKQFNGTQIGDGIASGGITLPAGMNGCNQFIAQISFRVRVRGGQSPTPTPTPTTTPTPTPTPTPVVTPTPSPGGQQQEQSQSQTQNNTQTQTVNVTQNVTQPTPAPGEVAGISELPKTGVTVLAWSALASGAPIGFGLRWYATRLRRRSQLEPDLDTADGSSWLELTAQRKGIR